MRYVFTLLTVCLFTLGLSAQEYTWKAVKMDGSRAGCRYAMQDDIDESIGTIKRGRYTAPNGRKFKKNSDVAEVAALVINAQPAMYLKKQIIGYTDHEIKEGKPESELSNMIVDLMMQEAQAETGKPVHMGVLNYGGIRTNLPPGRILLDDVESMLPFQNYLVYIQHKGSEIRKILEDMCPRFQALGGVRVVVENKKITSIEIAGEPLDDDKVYGVVSITFLLNGGDGIFLANNALSVDTLGILVREPVMKHITKETEAGRKIGYKKDGRVIIRR